MPKLLSVTKVSTAALPMLVFSRQANDVSDVSEVICGAIQLD